MTVSLIITTYNWPRALYLCLDSVMQQTVMPSEILVADDGSGISTRDVVRHFQNISPVPVHHIWHEDRGFRVAAIRNKAIAASSGRLCYPCRWRPDPATQFHSGPYPLRPGGVLCFGLPRHHHRNADPKGPQRRDHLAVGADQRRAQQQQRHARARHGHRLPHDRPLAGPQKLQSGVVAPGPDPRQRIRRGIRGLGIRRYGTGAASEQQRRTAASHEIPGRRLPPPSRQSLAGKLRHQRTALSGKHPRAPHPLRKGPRPAPYPENILSRGGSAAVVGG